LGLASTRRENTVNDQAILFEDDDEEFRKIIICQPLPFSR